MQRRLGGAALAATVLLAACGGSPLQGPSREAVERQSIADRQWIANMRGVIDQLQGDVGLTEPAARDLGTAREALRDDSDLYALLIAYTDFGGCSRMVAHAGRAGPRFGHVERTLAAACRRLQRAATLFTEAATATDGHLLLAASREAAGASPLLVRATLQLAAVRAGGATTERAG